MAFNIGAFFGGMAKGGSQILDENRAQAKRDKETNEAQQWEIAREGRQNAEYRKRLRDTDRKAADQFTSQLASFNFTPENITAIAAGGAENVKTWVDIALQHKKTGKEWDINLLVNNKVPTDVGTITEATNDVIDPSEITGSSNELFASMYEEADPVFKDLNNSFDYYQNKANNATGAKKIKYQAQADASLNSLKEKQAELKDSGTSTNGDLFTKTNIISLRDADIKLGLAAVNIGTDRVTGVAIRSQGDLGRYSIGVLNGIKKSRAFNTTEDGSIASENFNSSLDILEKQARQNLKLHADKAIGGEAQFVTQFIKTEDLMTNFGTDFVIPPKQTAAFTKGFVPESVLDIAEEQGAFTFGSVVKMVDVNGVMRIMVYTGIEGSEFSTTHMIDPEAS